MSEDLMDQKERERDGGGSSYLKLENSVVDYPAAEAKSP